MDINFKTIGGQPILGVGDIPIVPTNINVTAGSALIIPGTTGSELFNSANIIQNAGLTYQNPTVIDPANTTYDHAIIPITANTFYSVAGDYVQQVAPGSAQSYLIAKKVGENYVAYTDAELKAAGFYLGSPFRPSLNNPEMIFYSPNLPDMYLIFNTRFMAISNASTLSIKIGTRRDATILPNFVPHRLSGKNIGFFGDSTMAGGLSQAITTKIAANKGSAHLAVGGHTTLGLKYVMTGTNGYPAQNYNKYEAILIYVGFNGPNSGGAEAGTKADIEGVNPPIANTFWGNIGACIEFVQASNPNCEINILVQHNSDRWMTTRATNKNYEDTLTAIGEYYGCRVINVRRASQINAKNITQFTTDGLHLNSLGNQRVADTIIAQL